MDWFSRLFSFWFFLDCIPLFSPFLSQIPLPNTLHLLHWCNNSQTTALAFIVLECHALYFNIQTIDSGMEWRINNNIVAVAVCEWEVVGE